MPVDLGQEQCLDHWKSAISAFSPALNQIHIFILQSQTVSTSPSTPLNTWLGFSYWFPELERQQHDTVLAQNTTVETTATKTCKVYTTFSQVIFIVTLKE